jgi:Uncharacterized phage-associated protein
MYSPLNIANKFIELACVAGTPITQMQAQKLTYIAHGLNLGHKGAPLLTTPVCAWRYGPVVPVLYNYLKHYGRSAINQPIFVPPAIAEQFDPATEQLLETVYRYYGRYSAEELSTFTHREGTPWKKATDANLDIIPDSFIQDYYKRLLQGDTNCIGL